MARSNLPTSENAASEPAAPVVSELKFEAALAELELIVQSMEGGRLALEESIAAYRRGSELLKHCQQQLSDAENKIRFSKTVCSASSTLTRLRRRFAMSVEFPTGCRAFKRALESALGQRLPSADAIPARLHQAMRYASLGGGKRVVRCLPSPPAN